MYTVSVQGQSVEVWLGRLDSSCKYKHEVGWGAWWLGFSLGQPCRVAPQQARKICVVGRSVGGGDLGEEEAAFQLCKLFRFNCKTGEDGDQHSGDLIGTGSDTFWLWIAVTLDRKWHRLFICYLPTAIFWWFKSHLIKNEWTANFCLVFEHIRITFILKLKCSLQCEITSIFFFYKQ